MIGLDIVKNNKRKFINNYNLSLLSNIENVYKYLTNVHKLTPTQATALMGNIMLESSWNPSAKQINGDKALGLFQMHGDLLKAYQKYLLTTGKKDSLYSPLDYVVDMIKESKDSKGNLLAPHPYTAEYNRVYSLVKPYLGKSNLTPRLLNDVNYYYNTYGNRLRSGKLYLINDLLNAWNNPETSVKDLTKIFTNVFERSGNPEYDKRVGYALEYYDYYKPSYKVGGKLNKYLLGRNIELSNDAILRKLVVPLEYIVPIPKMTNSQRRDLFLQNNQTYLNSDNRERSERQRSHQQAEQAREVQRKEQQKQKNEEAFLNLLNLTSPSTYIGQAIGLPLTGPTALAVDAVSLGGAGALSRGIQSAVKVGSKLGKKALVSREFNRAVNSPYFSKGVSIERTALIPIESSYMYHNYGNPSLGFVRDGIHYNLERGPGSVKIQNGKYASSRVSVSPEKDRIWWDTNGHNYGSNVLVTKLDGFKLDDPNSGAIPFGGYYLDSYRTTFRPDVSSVVRFKYDPIGNTYTAYSPFRLITTNKMSLDELFTPEISKAVKEPTTSLKFFERNPSRISETERLGISKGERNLPFKPKLLTEHIQGNEAVKMFKEYGGEPIPEGSINGELLKKYVAEARERYGLVRNNNITDEEIAQALYKHSKELGGNTAAVNILGEPLLLFRGDTNRYTLLKEKISPEELAKKRGTMDNSLGNLFLGEFPNSYRGVDRYIGTWRNFNGNPRLVGSGTGSKVVWDGKIASEIEGYPYLGPLAGGGYKLYSLPHRYGNIDVYKLPASMMESGVNDLNAFIVRTPLMRNATSEISVLNDDWMLQGAKDSHFMSKNYKYNPKTLSMENVKTGESLGEITTESAPESRVAMGDHYKELLKEAEQKLQGLLKSEANSPLRDEHSQYSYFALPNFNIQGAKHLLPYDLRIPRNWKDKNIYRGLIPVIGGYSLYNLLNLPLKQL